MELLFDDDFGVSEGDSSDEDGDGVFAYAGQQHFDSAEVVALSKGNRPYQLVPPLMIVFLIREMVQVTRKLLILNARNSSSQVNLNIKGYK